MAGGDGLTIKLSDEQARAIVERYGGDTMADGTSDLALLTLSLRRILAEQGSGEVSYALVRGLLVLAAFSADGTPRRLSEVAAELGMKTSTVHRCLGTLVVVGLLEQDGENSSLLPTGPTFRLAGRFPDKRCPTYPGRPACCRGLSVRAAYGRFGLRLGAISEAEGRGEGEPAVRAVLGQQDAPGVIGDLVVLRVFVVGDAARSERCREREDRNIGRFGDTRDQRDGRREITAERCRGGEHDAGEH